MKIGFHYRTYEDCAIILYMFSDNEFHSENDSDTFSFSYKNDEYIFSKKDEVIEKCDYKIYLFHTFTEWKKFKGYDKLIQTQLVENYHITNSELIEYLDAGNISLSSASISFEHPNFYYDPIFNLIFFYYHYGYNFLNYYKFDNKENLLGIYHKPDNGINVNKGHRNYLFSQIKNELVNEFIAYPSNEYNHKLLLQPYATFGHWGNNHITSYIDFTTSVCNVIFETLHSNGNDEEPNSKMHGRQYITEKTLKSICFSEENIFFIWYGPSKLFKHLIKLGFWFLNCEFYDETKTTLEQSVIDTSIYLKELKEKIGNNKVVHGYLMNLYGVKLQQNVSVFKKLLNNYNNKDIVLNLIKNERRS
jgi:hypothetical protein